MLAVSPRSGRTMCVGNRPHSSRSALIGSIGDAYCARTQAAGAAMRRRGSAMPAAGEDAHHQPGSNPDGAQCQPLPQDHPDRLALVRAHCDANADLASPPAHRVSHQAVPAGHRQRQPHLARGGYDLNCRVRLRHGTLFAGFPHGANVETCMSGSSRCTTSRSPGAMVAASEASDSATSVSPECACCRKGRPVGHRNVPGQKWFGCYANFLTVA